ncbi:DarT ssDNA thymidine ADP-ribosyltransferase family protein [Hydrogenophaga sp. 2FB]|uniref:DarT ssDNA thymidine ADP-ribosyltransferase family protein n=1 Tax=Hydrogenophaga sp. 2FB TaxID=2502187 RepID=UPI0010F7C2E6|nr:DarT ssDNA thymidine ADP-ribosyltransferase family protein [Hydrogenophaga sp. 2FB]
MATIEQECATRNIDRLFHFTPVEHLDSILKHGLLTPRTCAVRSVAYKANDAARYDGQDAICLSIEWPNWSLFWSFRQRDTSKHWALLQLKHSLLWEKRVCFNSTNAADNSMSSLTFLARQGVGKFVELFDDYGLKKRVDLNIPAHQTTNPQAEVLCIDNIEPTYVTDVHLLDVDLYRRYKETYPGKHVTHGSQYFKYRDDWNHWK